jgi:hypothetical protein
VKKKSPAFAGLFVITLFTVSVEVVVAPLEYLVALVAVVP